MKKSASKRYEILFSLAKQQSRPQLERDLAKARKEYAAANADYSQSMSEFMAAQTKVENAQKRMSDARKRILDISGFVQVMDLTGAGAIRQRGDSINYIMDGKEYHVDMSNPEELQTIPWREYRRLKNEESGEDSEETGDAEEALKDELEAIDRG